MRYLSVVVLLAVSANGQGFLEDPLAPIAGLDPIVGAILSMFFSVGPAKESTQQQNRAILADSLVRLGDILGNLNTNSQKVNPAQVEATISWLMRFQQAIQTGQNIAAMIGQYRTIYGGFSVRGNGQAAANYAKWSAIALDTAQGLLSVLQQQRAGIPMDAIIWEQYRSASDNAVGWMQAHQITNRFLYSQNLQLQQLKAVIMAKAESDTAWQSRQAQIQDQGRQAAEDFFLNSPLPDRGHEAALVP